LWADAWHQLHQGCFATTYRTSEQYAFVEVDAIGCAGVFVFDGVDHQFVNEVAVFFINPEVFAEALFSFCFDELKGVVEIVDDLIVDVFAQGVCGVVVDDCE